MITPVLEIIKSATSFLRDGPNASNAAKQLAFQANISKATEYSIAINVAPGASVGAINDALISAIQEYERKKGKIK